VIIATFLKLPGVSSLFLKNSTGFYYSDNVSKINMNPEMSKLNYSRNFSKSLPNCHTMLQKLSLTPGFLRTKNFCNNFKLAIQAMAL
jgi:hypothetical protein